MNYLPVGVFQNLHDSENVLSIVSRMLFPYHKNTNVYFCSFKKHYFIVLFTKVGFMLVKTDAFLQLIFLIQGSTWWYDAARQT